MSHQHLPSTSSPTSPPTATSHEAGDQATIMYQTISHNSTLSWGPSSQSAGQPFVPYNSQSSGFLSHPFPMSLADQHLHSPCQMTPCLQCFNQGPLLQGLPTPPVLINIYPTYSGVMTTPQLNPIILTPFPPQQQPQMMYPVPQPVPQMMYAQEVMTHPQEVPQPQMVTQPQGPTEQHNNETSSEMRLQSSTTRVQRAPRRQAQGHGARGSQACETREEYFGETVPRNGWKPYYRVRNSAGSYYKLKY
ncbi:uncharacterized protein LOC118433457 [Folsomia candida]|uniref:uncharacterized protein LOC118433457 n=1 Tax=Folsomia candida TaxID=158441 RepID=UPI001605524D|nr:uncharacterized protein LOC118433457 [Folsomia candida]